MDRLVCGNSNMRNLTEEDIRNQRSSRCSLKDPCSCCLSRLGRIKLKELIKLEEMLDCSSKTSEAKDE